MIGKEESIAIFTSTALPPTRREAPPRRFGSAVMRKEYGLQGDYDALCL
jgi:hypothetical protein